MKTELVPSCSGPTYPPDDEFRCSDACAVPQPRRRAVHEVYKTLIGWDTSIIEEYAVEKGIYTADEVAGVAVEYRKFVSLCIGHPNDVIPISEKVDNFWHLHILFTQDYTDMCDTLFGFYLHHRPAILDRKLGLERAFDVNTVPLYIQYFGEPDTRFWNKALCCGQGCGKPESYARRQ